MAENSSVVRCLGKKLKMRCKSGKKPMSSMRSASSSTTYSTWLSTAFLASMWSSKRPGVATSTSTPLFSSRVWGFMSMPPNTTVLRNWVYLAYNLICWATWSASSRVGSNTRARTGCRAGDVEGFSCLSSRCSKGSEKAAVLPVPVWAAPITSWPVNTTGMAWAWIGVMDS